MNKRPTRIANEIIIAFLVLCFTFWYALRVYSTLENWQSFLDYGANPIYILATGLIWFAAGVLMLVLIWKKHLFTIRAGLLIAGLYTSWYWIDRVFIQASPAPNGIFSAVVSAVLLVIFSFVLITSAV